jgi:hypothetical protein
VSQRAHTTRIRLARRTASCWRVAFDNPPLNTFGPETMLQLNKIVTALETNEHVKVVVFDSAVDGFFLHYNFLARLQDTTSVVPGPTSSSPLPDMLVRPPSHSAPQIQRRIRLSRQAIVKTLSRDKSSAPPSSRRHQRSRAAAGSAEIVEGGCGGPGVFVIRERRQLKLS